MSDGQYDPLIRNSERTHERIKAYAEKLWRGEGGDMIVSSKSPEAVAADEALLERTLATNSTALFKGERMVEGKIAPQPSQSEDQRMHLTLGDMETCYDPPRVEIKGKVIRLVNVREHPTQEQTEREQAKKEVAKGKPLP